jgi:GT2 family glycosyltransferase
MDVRTRHATARRDGGGKTIVVLGMMSKRPWAGIVWITIQYLIGLRRLGYDVYYVESHACTPSMFVAEHDDGSCGAARFIASVMDRFGMTGRWAFHALHSDGTCFGLSEMQLRRLYRSSALLLNLHGATTPLPEHAETGRLVYVGTDPVQVEVEVHHGDQRAIDFLEPHVAFFTWGENLGRPSCRVPTSERFAFLPTRQPIVMDFWESGAPPGEAFTTVANWKQVGNEITLEDEVYHWSKHLEFLKFLELPRRSAHRFELALSACDDTDRHLLESHGWRVRDALSISKTAEDYRAYIDGSFGEFTVAKDQNVRLRTGWFSDRSASYLASGRPVVTQETGFSENLPTGRGLFAFSTADDIVAAIEDIGSDYRRHSRAASALAREHFGHDVVLSALLSEVGLDRPSSATSSARVAAGERRGGVPCLVPDLDLVPLSRRPPRLPGATVQRVLAAPPLRSSAAGRPLGSRAPVPATVAVATVDNLVFLKLCLESVLENPDSPREVVVVDNGSSDATSAYLRALAEAQPTVRPIFNQTNLGFAAAINQALVEAAGDVIVVLNDDVIVPAGWLTLFTRHLENPELGLVSAVTNRSADEAEIPASYRTYGDFIAFADETAQSRLGVLREVSGLSLFCTAMRRTVYKQVGRFDERFGLGLFEDDDYVRRTRATGLVVACAEDVFVHHFGGATTGRLAGRGEYGSLFHENRRRYEEKWQTEWKPRKRRADAEYELLRDRVRAVVRQAIPPGATILVTSKGDEELLHLDGLEARHFPGTDDGTYAGYNPADSASAISLLEDERARGAEFLLLPRTAFWWLEYYDQFKSHLDDRYAQVEVVGDSCRIFALAPRNDVPRRLLPGRCR